MRWDNLRLDAGDELPLIERGAVVRTFDTPGFRGMTFYEVQAKSIVSRVPDSSRMPFRWTINPYRGCQHACVYCVSGDTEILMGNGRTKLISDVRVGDAIYGTIREGFYRRYAMTEVLAHWSTVKPAYRVTLEDGTKLVTSGDHRFLTERGWKHVTGAEAGQEQRPFLTVNSKLMGLGAFAEPPDQGTPLKSDARLRVAAIEPLGIDLPMYDITTGTGDFIANGVVSHNCFARNSHTYLELDSGADFDSKVVVKVNAPELLRRKLASAGWPGEHIAMGTNVDCYQRAEGKYQLMRGIIAALRDAANPFSILTKGTLILRDVDLLLQAAEVTEVGLNVSAAFVDKELWRAIEPGTPAPERRIEACAALNDAGLPCGVLMGPVVPFLSDSPAQLEAAVRQIAAAGAPHVSPIVLHLRTGTREWFLRWLGAAHPELVDRYADLYARGAYAPKDYQARIAGQVRELADKHGVGRPRQVRAAQSRAVKPAATAMSAPPPAAPIQRPGAQARPAGHEQLTLL
jgi:DNA repair photolyase